MACPKRKVSKMKHRSRHAHWKCEVTHVIRCRNCGGKHQPHVVCPYCGHYKGREIMAAKLEQAS